MTPMVLFDSGARRDAYFWLTYFLLVGLLLNGTALIVLTGWFDHLTFLIVPYKAVLPSASIAFFWGMF